MRHFIIPNILISLLLSVQASAQYEPMSPYLNDPELTIAYVDSCAQFWIQALDESRGGFYTNIDRFGNVISSWGTNKNLLTQTRDAYGFVRAYMLTGNETYRAYAEAGLDFMYEHAWDSVNGGWYSQLDINGNVIGANSGRSAFDEHYALLGPAAAFEAFGDSTDLNMLLAGYAHLEEVFWDDRPGYTGYFDWATATSSAAYDKSFNATVDAITTHVLSLYLQTEEPIYLERLQEISQEIIDRLVGSMPDQAIGFVEKYDSNWNWDNSETMTIMGHVLKAAWCLIRVYQLDPQPEYLEAAEVLVSDVLDHGYDHELGGPYKDYNRNTGAMLMWGNPDTAKAWWQMEQAVTAGLELWSVTNNDTYLQMADESLYFFMRFFVDHTYGDVYENRTRYGGETWGLNKGGGGKAAYHSIETGYYTYLYASLFLQEEPCSLYYWFEPVTSNRLILLNPLKSNLTPLVIVDVTLDGVAYPAFDGQSRILSIPGGTGGKFQVTFAPAAPTDLQSVVQPKDFLLSAPYPNPFNPSTSFQIQLDHVTTLQIEVINIRGQIVSRLVDGRYTAGVHTFTWDGRDSGQQPLEAGVYLIRVHSQAHSQTCKVLLLK